MKTRIIHTKIWKDEYFAKLSEDEKLLFIYLITNEKINICGIYEVTNREIMFDTQFTSDTLVGIKEKFQADGKFYFYENWIVILNCYKYQNYTGPQNFKAGLKEMTFVPGELKGILTEIGCRYPIDTLSPEADAPINQKVETNNKEPEVKDQRLNGSGYSAFKKVGADLFGSKAVK